MSEDPREVLAYLRQRGRPGLVTDATGDDITDALTLKVWLWWELEATELWLLEAGEALGRRRKTIGAVLGLAEGQSLVDRIKRLRGRLRREQVTAVPVAATSRDEQIRQVAADLIAARHEIPEDIADELPLMVIAEALPSWRPDAPPRDTAVLNALRWLLGDLAAVVPAGIPLRKIVDTGIDLVGAHTIPEE